MCESTDRSVRLFALCVGAAFLVGSVARAAPGPTTRAVETPEIGLRAYNHFMQKVDQPGMMRRVYAPTPALVALAKSFSYSDGQIASAAHTAQRKFGGDAGKQVGRAFNDISDDDMVGGKADLDETGTRGNFVTVAGGSVPMCLDGGTWKIDARGLVMSPDERVIAAQIQIHINRGDFSKALAASIDAGDVTTIDQVLERIVRRVDQ